MDVKTSITTCWRLKTPALAPWYNIAYSPDTWYTARGWEGY